MSTSSWRGHGLGVLAGLLFGIIGFDAGAHETEIRQEICTIDQDEMVVRIVQELAPDSRLITAIDQELSDAVLHIINHNPECVLEVVVATTTVRPDAAFVVGTVVAMVAPEQAEEVLAAARQVAAAPAAGQPTGSPAAPAGQSQAEPRGPYSGPENSARLTPQDDDDDEVEIEIEVDVSPS